MLSSRLRAGGIKKEEMSFVSTEKINTFLYNILYVRGFVERILMRGFTRILDIKGHYPILEFNLFVIIMRIKTDVFKIPKMEF